VSKGAATWFFQNVSTGNTWREANPGLKPERTQMVDFGVDYVSPNGRTRASATGYWGRIKDARSLSKAYSFGATRGMAPAA
jgi:iron complex outermembrane receptor protein